MKSYRNVKKIIAIGIIGILGCDVTLLFAAQTDLPDNSTLQQQQLAQIQQLQQQTTASSTLPAPPSDSVNNGAASNDNFNNAPDTTNGLTATAAPDPSTTASAPDPTVATSSPTPSTPVATNTLPPPASAAPTGAGAPVAPAGSVSQSTLRDQAFNTMAQNQLPMSPEQIQRLRQLFNQTQYAAAAPAGIPPRPTATSQFVNLAPGSTPPVIRLAQGFVSSIVFIDSTGAPWPIDNYDIGNPSAFNIQWNKEDNTLMIQAIMPYTYGNLAVRLKNLSTPVMITLVPGQKAVDYRVDMRIPGMGPNALPIPVTGLPSSASPELLGVLDGVPPDNSSELQVSGGGCQAWVRGDQLFVRTRYTLLSPGWIATMSSADGMKAYLLPKAPLLLAAENGKIVQLKIEGL